MSEESEEPEKFAEPVYLTPSSQIGMQRRHLPHWQLESGFYFVTWRLADSLPQSKLRCWMEEKRDWLRSHPRPWDKTTLAEYRERFPARVERWLDSGYGSCVLQKRNCAAIVADAIHFFDGKRYDVASFVIMPNHVHLLFQLRGSHHIETVLGNLKSYSALQINRTLSREGALWQQENWDRLLRSPADLARCFAYIKKNPNAAGLSQESYLYYEFPGFLSDDLP